MNSRIDVEGFLDKLDAALRGYRDIHGNLDNIEDVVDMIGASLLQGAGVSLCESMNILFDEFGFVESDGQILMVHLPCKRGSEVNGFPFALIEATEAAFAHDMECKGEETE